MWVPKGDVPIAVVCPKYQWTYVYGFVCPSTGQTFWLILPAVNIAWFNLALAQLAKALELGAKRRIVLVVDRAGWHSSQQVKVPDGIHLTFLPAYSPELQPAERLWPLTNEAIANRYWPDLDSLEQQVEKRCQQLSQQRGLIRGLTCYHWWPKADVN